MGEHAACPNRIRDLRTARGLTQEGLAALLGEDTSIATVSRLESGRMTLTLPWMERISDALGIMPHEIIARPGKGLRMVPLVDMARVESWQDHLKKAATWIPAPETVGGQNCFAVRPAADSIGLNDHGPHFVIVDPEQKALEDDRSYLVRTESRGVSFRRFQSDTMSLVALGLVQPIQETFAVGSEPFEVIGRVTYMGFEL